MLQRLKINGIIEHRLLLSLRRFQGYVYETTGGLVVRLD